MKSAGTLGDGRVLALRVLARSRRGRAIERLRTRRAHDRRRADRCGPLAEGWRRVAEGAVRCETAAGRRGAYRWRAQQPARRCHLNCRFSKVDFFCRADADLSICEDVATGIRS